REDGRGLDAGLAEPSAVHLLYLAGAVDLGEGAVRHESEIRIVASHDEGIGLVGKQLTPQAVLPWICRLHDLADQDDLIGGESNDLPCIQLLHGLFAARN